MRLPAPDLQRLDRLKKYPLAAKHAPALRDFVARAQPYELRRVNPLYLAERLRWSRNETLDVLTYAVAEDLWRLHWEAYCPACGGLLQESGNLGDLHHHQVCRVCGWEGEIALDRELAVEASLSEDVRRFPPEERDNAAFRQTVQSRLGRLPALALVNRPLFRELLGAQTLPPNQSLGVERLVVFFSDLKSSTALYERLGDAQAYQLVRAHFDVIFQAVEAEGGAAVKTIGDGVMGTFFEPQAAMRGIAAALRGLEAVNQRHDLHGENRLRLKVGVHMGACIVVTLNHRLDYFGTTVNVAARLSDLSGGDEVVLSETLLTDPATRQLVASLGETRPLHTTLRGLSRPISTHRLRVGEKDR